MPTLEAALSPFRLARYRIALRAVEPVTLPPYKGSTFRGAFAGAFKRLVCVRPDLSQCDPCPHLHDCAYPYVFETRPPAALSRTGFQQYPRPFVIEPPPEERADYAPGDLIRLHLVLVGRATEYLPHFVLTLRALAEAGVGRGRGQVKVQRVEAIPLAAPPQPIYEEGSSLLQAGGSLIDGDTITALSRGWPADRLTLHFTTPTHLTHHGAMAPQPEFPILARALFRRASALAMAHCGYRMELDYPAWIARAEAIRLDAWDGETVQWERFSSRQDRKVRHAGLVGRATYSGDLAPFLPLLALGALLHVGDGCVFGMGRYRPLLLDID